MSALVDLQSLFALWVNLNSRLRSRLVVLTGQICLVKTTLSVSGNRVQHFQQRWSAPQVTHQDPWGSLGTVHDYMKLFEQRGRERNRFNFSPLQHSTPERRIEDVLDLMDLAHELSKIPVLPSFFTDLKRDHHNSFVTKGRNRCR